MASWHTSITPDIQATIEAQHLFFVATAPSDPDAPVNLSPKGRTLARVLGPNLVGWLDYPGSGNETAAHTADNGRITLMFCNFGPTAGIVRLYGRGRAVDLDDPLLAKYRDVFLQDAHAYVRQAFFVDIESVQSSCGYAVPRMEYVSERDTLDRYCERTLEPRELVDGMPTGAGDLPKRQATTSASQ